MLNDRQTRPPQNIQRPMSKVEQYRRGLELCLANAAKAPSAELRAVWQTIAESYAYLAELEANGGHTPGFANGDGGNATLAEQRFNGSPAADRIRS
jgi:hypothetical protein